MRHIEEDLDPETLLFTETHEKVYITFDEYSKYVYRSLQVTTFKPVTNRDEEFYFRGEVWRLDSVSIQMECSKRDLPTYELNLTPVSTTIAGE